MTAQNSINVFFYFKLLLSLDQKMPVLSSLLHAKENRGTPRLAKTGLKVPQLGIAIFLFSHGEPLCCGNL